MSEKIINILFPQIGRECEYFHRLYTKTKDALSELLNIEIPEWVKNIPKALNQNQTLTMIKSPLIISEANNKDILDQIYRIIEKLAQYLTGTLNFCLNDFSNSINKLRPMVLWPHQELIYAQTVKSLEFIGLGSLFDDEPVDEKEFFWDIFIFQDFQSTYDRISLILEPDILKLPLGFHNLIKDIFHNIKVILSELEDWKTSQWRRPKEIIGLGYVITLDKLHSMVDQNTFDTILQHILTNGELIKEYAENIDFHPKELRDFYVNQRDCTKIKPVPVEIEYNNPILSNLFFQNISVKTASSMLDGLIIKGDNYHALMLLSQQFKNKIKTIFIDPPFNKETDLCDSVLKYKVDYSDSVWMSLLFPRITLGKALLNDNGSIFVRCDYAGNYLMRYLLNEIFGIENFRNEFVVRRGAPKASLFKQFNEIKSVGVSYDNLYWYSMKPGTSFKPFYKSAAEHQRHGKWCSFKKIYDRPNLRYEILGINLEKGQWMWKQSRAMVAIENYRRYQKVNTAVPIELEEYWKKNGSKEEYIRRKKDSIQYWVPPREKVLCDNNWTDIPGYASGRRFKTENSEELLERIILSTTEPGDWIMDFFLGSGTTTAVAQKLGRKWIGVEIGHQFEEVIIPRMKKVLFGDKSGISKNNQWQGGGFFAYYRIDQFFADIEKNNHRRIQQRQSIDHSDENHDFDPEYVKLPDLFNLSLKGSS